jgi:hypothetical protein
VKLLPYIRLTFRAADPPEVVSARIAAMITPRRFYLKRPAEPFRGTIRGSHFKVMRVLSLFVRNSFQPVIVGEVAQGALGAEVRVRMRLHAAVAAFTICWFGGLALFGGRVVYDAATKNPPRPGPVLAVLAGMALFAYGLVSISFWSEVKKARLLLRDGLGLADTDTQEG